jgi:hypothetical protein
MAHDGPPLDPDEVLGVGPGATVEALREALRVKSLKHHPDRGGDAWAFRVVHWAYQTRLEQAKRAASRPSPTIATPPPPPPPVSSMPVGARWEAPRPGVQDRGLDPAQLVEAEMVWVLREADVGLLGLPRPGEDRSQGARLTLQWPARQVNDDPQTIPHADRVFRALGAVFDEASEHPGVTSARSDIVNGRFNAWLSYKSAGDAKEALRRLHVGLRARGLGLCQWTRILAVPPSVKK